MAFLAVMGLSSAMLQQMPMRYRLAPSFSSGSEPEWPFFIEYFERPGLDEARRLLADFAEADQPDETWSVSSWISRLLGVDDESDVDEQDVFKTAWRAVRQALPMDAPVEPARAATALLADWAARMGHAEARVARGVAIAEYVCRTPYCYDGSVVAAALLSEAHDEGLEIEAVRGRVGNDTAALLRSLSIIEQLYRLQRARWDAETALPAAGEGEDDRLLYSCRLPATHADNLRNMLVAVAGDYRALPLSLARRVDGLHLEVAAAQGQASPSALARDALDVHAPLAERFGLYSLKNDLEDAAFERLAPAARKRIVDGLDDSRQARDAVLKDVTQRLKQLMMEDDVIRNAVTKIRVTLREKAPFSVWRKQRKLRQRREGDAHSDFLEVWTHGKEDSVDREPVLYPLDTIAFRVVFSPKRAEDSAALCYHALKLVHRTWPSMANRTKDYIEDPKPNGYQSLHTTVVTRLHRRKYPFEVQIRTGDMHTVAEFGSAAHVLYSRGASAAPRRPGRRRNLRVVAGRPSRGRRRSVFIARRHAAPRASEDLLDRIYREHHVRVQDHDTRANRPTPVDDRALPAVLRSLPGDDRPKSIGVPFRMRRERAPSPDDSAVHAAQTGAVLGASLGRRLRAERVFVLAAGGRVLTVRPRSSASDVRHALLRDIEADESLSTAEAADDRRLSGVADHHRSDTRHPPD